MVVIDEEVEKLSDVGVIIEIKYSTWMTNVVLVWKTNNRLSMYVSFTDLNASYFKDPYSLPDIDCLIDGSPGYCMLSSIDAYSGYN